MDPAQMPKIFPGAVQIWSAAIQKGTVSSLQPAVHPFIFQRTGTMLYQKKQIGGKILACAVMRLPSLQVAYLLQMQ
ncbi:hypothetical protein SUBVAR_04881 [Subdoligranulum variabile DSM 15176]|uniref:Uncharacterized protein n=1 Tax=Subdoligranulum variabile DSM 15176 TaxID=411471 RepID=D1PKK5_9FIRM|nr:hypothetical protein SUBVAR_04881 [Subdoligranulum variabile DSM 15176]